ncbi:MAG: STM4015 family protein [Eubacterium sp.]|nr:STM4015 family protein [Eubacterium sp.]
MYSYTYEQYEDDDRSSDSMVEDILADPDFPRLKELIIGDWGDAWEDSCQPILNGIVEHAKQFSHIEKLFIGDMNYEQCEVSWIIQGDYSKLWAALPNLKGLTIKGSTDLVLGEICHEGLEELTIICGGIGSDVLSSIQNAKLPNLKKLLLYIGAENYGFDGNADTIRELLANADFPKLQYLGITNSEIQDELAKVVLESKFMGQIETLDLSMGTLTDKGGALLLEEIVKWPNVKALDVHYHYLSDEMAENLIKLPMDVDVSEPNEPDEYNGTIYFNAMLTE